MTIRIAIIGFGTIARGEHVPAIAGDPDFELVAVVAPNGAREAGVPVFASLGEMLAAMPGAIDAVTIATPPRVRHAIAAEAIAAGLAVLLEKPPTATLGELEDLAARARAAGTALFAAWHSQHAPAVAPAARLLAGETVTHLAITWRENVERWHPGQAWIWEPEGFGVLDTGINPLSIVSRILPQPLLVVAAAFLIPEGRDAPIAARIEFAGGAHSAIFDWRAADDEERSIRIKTASGHRLSILSGGAGLTVDGATLAVKSISEYSSLYNRFQKVIAASNVMVDAAPLRILADAALLARRLSTGQHS